MSKRYRLELERTQNLKQEVEEEEDKLKLQRQRIFAPVIWQRLASGYRIEDLKENKHEEVLDMIKEYLIPEEVLTRNVEMTQDTLSTQSFLSQLLFNLKDNTSLIVVDETNEQLAGVLVLKTVNQTDFGRAFSRAKLIEGEAHKKCVKFKNHLNKKVDIFVEFDCDVYLRFYALCIKPEYRKKGLGFQLMRSAINEAISMNIPVVMGIFTCFSMQKLAKKIGMRVIHEIGYVEWRDESGELVFDDPGAGNYTCAIMAGKVPSEPLPLQLVIKPPEEEQEVKPEKKTRKEKRASKKK